VSDLMILADGGQCAMGFPFEIVIGVPLGDIK